MSDLTMGQVDTLLDALRKALEGASQDDAGAMTTEELATEMRVSIATTRARLKALLGEGKAECVRVKRQRIDGAFQMMPAYKLKG